MSKIIKPIEPIGPPISIDPELIPMDLETMECANVSSGFKGKVFRKQWKGNGSFISNALILPYNAIYGISISSSGSPVISLSNSSEEDIAGGSGIWNDWDGSSAIDKAMTAIKITNDSDDYTVNVVVKTSD